jgi:hypothetical protein
MQDRQKSERNPREILLDKVRRGQLTPDEAEQEAAKQGFGPLAKKPDPVAFNPDQMPWWSLPMALAWIAWRNSSSVREHCADYTERYTCWVSGSCNVPINGGQEWALIDGYELKTLGPPTVARLLLLPATRDAVMDGERQLLDALAEGRIVASAKDAAGNIVDIPTREWPHLELFEDGQADVLFRRDRHDDGPVFSETKLPVYSEIKLPRDALKQVWPETIPDKSGGQSFTAADDALIEEMRAMIQNGKAKNVTDAARVVAPKARRLGSLDSAVERLQRRYGRKHPTRQRR